MSSRDDVTVDIHQIAEMAGVGRTAVSNWRQRHHSFPRPDAAGRFPLVQVRHWLIEHDKMPAAPAPEVELWALFNTLRSSSLSTRDATALVVALLVYLAACDRPGSQGAQVKVKAIASTSWDEIRGHVGPLYDRLMKKAQVLEFRNPVLEGLIIEPLERATAVDEHVLYQLVDTLHQLTKTTHSWELFDDLVGAATKADRFQGETATPDDVAELMVRIGGTDADVIADPATGEGGLLLSASIHPQRATAPRTVCGYEVNPEVARTARSRFFLYDVPVELRQADAFTVPQVDLPAADLVLLDPPLGPQRWASAEVMMDPRWEFGVPPPDRSELAWIQLAHQMLRNGGRAVVCTSHASLFRDHREAEIRRSMLQAGLIEAIVSLPGRVRPDTSIPLAIWTVRRHGPNAPKADRVLFVDGTSLGTAGRSQHTFEDSEIERLARCVRTFAGGDVPADPEIAWTVPITDIDPSDLDPLRYRPAPTVDLGPLVQRAEELRASIRDTTSRLEEALNRLATHGQEHQ